MSWEAVKYAINSKLGEEDFKPLNEMIEYNTKIAVVPTTSSSDLLATIIRGGATEDVTIEAKSKRYRFGMDAEISIGYSVGSNDALIGIIISVYKNDEEVYTRSHAGEQSIVGGNFSTQNISFKKGDILTFEYKKHPNYSSYEARVYSAGVFGIVKPQVVEVIS